MVRTLYSKNNKAQIIATDFILAVIILIFIMVVSISMWKNEIDNLRLHERRTEMENLALSIADILVRSPGNPEDWELRDEVEITLGLANESHVLDKEKVSKLLTMSQDDVKNILGIDNFNFFIRITYPNNVLVEEYGTPPANAEEVVVTRRLVIYDDEESYFNFGLYV